MHMEPDFCYYKDAHGLEVYLVDIGVLSKRHMYTVQRIVINL